MTNPAVPRRPLQQIRQAAARTDLFLLLFILGFTIDSVVVKPVALAGALLALLPQLKRLRFGDAPPFYLLIPAMEIIRFAVFNHDFSAGHWAAFIIGICYWLMAYAAFLIVRFRADKGGGPKMAHTLTIWFLINAAYSVCQLIVTMVHARSINPYALSDVQFGSSTGDYIRGIMLAPCHINMFVNSFFAVWFLFRGKWRYALLAAAICCLTTTNFATVIFLPVLAVLFFVLKEKKARFTILGAIGIYVVFSLVVATKNLSYLKASMENSAGSEMTLTPTIKSDTAGHKVNKDSIRVATKKLEAIYGEVARPNGKILSWKQTLAYFSSDASHALFGAGMGNFSSLLALQMAHIYGKKHSRFYEHIPTYVHADYYRNHYRIMYNVYSLPEGYHSARHMPHSFPNQIAGEYGLLGIIFFAAGYVWYFIRRGAARGFFLFIMILTAGYLWFDYLFEYLSVMVFFELLFWTHRQFLLNSAKDAGN